jgi:hypothetical protein
MALEGGFKDLRVVERDRHRELDNRLRVTLSERDRIGALPRPELVELRVAGDHHRVVVAVVGALDLDDQVALGGAAGEVDGRHRRFGPGVGEAPLRQSKAVAQVLRDDDRAVGGGGEVCALVVAGLDRLADHRARVTDAHHPEAVVEVDVLTAVDVPDQGTLAAIDVDRPGIVQLEGGGDAARHHLAGAVEVLGGGRSVLAEASHLFLGEAVDQLALDCRLAVCRLG